MTLESLQRRSCRRVEMKRRIRKRCYKESKYMLEDSLCIWFEKSPYIRNYSSAVYSIKSIDRTSHITHFSVTCPDRLLHKSIAAKMPIECSAVLVHEMRLHVNRTLSASFILSNISISTSSAVARIRFRACSNPSPGF